VLSQAFSVIRGKNDKALVDQLFGGKKIPEISNHIIDVPKFAVIAVAVFCLPLRRELVGCVEIVDVKEQEEWLFGITLQPLFRRLRNLGAGPLYIARVPGLRGEGAE
jgi:hypothetical protein